MDGPTLTGYVSFIRNIMQIDTTLLPDGSPRSEEHTSELQSH